MMALPPPPRFNLRTGRREEDGEGGALINLPTALLQQQPHNYRPQFYVEEASLYSIAEDSREGRESEVASRAGTESCMSTPQSTRQKQLSSTPSSPAEEGEEREPIPILVDWGLNIDNSGWSGSSNSFKSLIKDSSLGVDSSGKESSRADTYDSDYQEAYLGANKPPSQWAMPPTMPDLDAEEISTPSTEDYTYPSYPLSSVDPGSHVLKERCCCARGRVLYPVLIALVLAIIMVAISIPLLFTSDPVSTAVSGLAKDPGSNPTMSPTLSPSKSPTFSPTLRPTSAPSAALTFPQSVNTANEKQVFSALWKCPVNNLAQVADSSTLQNLGFSQLVAELNQDSSSSISQKELLERWALIMLYLSAGGELWNDGISWIYEDQHVCNWGDGTITCDSRLDGEAAVTGLLLSRNGLKGTIPKELCCLPKLQALDLSQNPGLTGRLPDCIGKMKLSILDLSGTGLD